MELANDENFPNNHLLINVDLPTKFPINISENGSLFKFD